MTSNLKDKLSEMGVKIYGIRALSSTHAIPFYEEISERTGGVSIQFTHFPLIVDMFLAICYREASAEKLVTKNFLVFLIFSKNLKRK